MALKGFAGAVTVRFADLPVALSFNRPWHFCMVTENAIKVRTFGAETYDPRDWKETGAGASFEPGMDEEGRHVRAWVQAASPEPDNEGPFQTWRGYDDPAIGYIAALGHMINYWHYRRSDTRLEQVCLQGMTKAADAQGGIVRLGWSWLLAPELVMAGHPRSHDSPTHDPAQKAWLVPREGTGPVDLSFELIAIHDDPDKAGTAWLVNPAFVVRDWNDAAVGPR